VPDGFNYASNTNPEQLTETALRQLIGMAAAA
jgi:UDP-N-acetylglucosamine 4,6-dehydratase